VHDLEAVLGLVVVAISVAALAPRLRAPAPSLLVLAGLGIGFIPGFPTVHVSPDLVTLGVLPPLLFAAAQQISLLDLREVWRPVAVLALGLVLLTAAAVAAVAHAVVPSLAAPVAFTFGAVLASTDPVAVTALSRELRLPTRLATLVQSESLFNDATSLVLFEVAVAAAVGTHVTAGEAIGRFVLLAVGGTAAGAVAGLAAGAALRRASEPSMQAAIAVVTPYVAAVGAHAAHVSPVTAVIVAGLMLSRRRARSRHSEGRLLAGSVYDVVVLVLENAIFAIIGLELASFLHDLQRSDTGRTIALVAATTATLLVVRGLALGVPIWLPRRSAGDADRAGRWQAGVVLTWAGARGVIPLAAALSIPLETNSGAPFPHRAMLLVAATAIVVITLVVQGTTLAPLVRRLGVATSAHEAADELRRARHALAIAALDRLDRLAASTQASTDVVDRLRRDLQQQAATTRDDSDGTPAGDGVAATSRLRQELLDVEAEELARLRLAGEISSETFRQVQRQLDIEHTRLRG
jgi:CPA1 family monovalent cation:H+ antiporter